RSCANTSTGTKPSSRDISQCRLVPRSRNFRESRRVIPRSSLIQNKASTPASSTPVIATKRHKSHRLLPELGDQALEFSLQRLNLGVLVMNLFLQIPDLASQIVLLLLEFLQRLNGNQRQLVILNHFVTLLVFDHQFRQNLLHFLSDEAE